MKLFPAVQYASVSVVDVVADTRFYVKPEYYYMLHAVNDMVPTLLPDSKLAKDFNMVEWVYWNNFPKSKNKRELLSDLEDMNERPAKKARFTENH